jgi:hypothetical protein
MTEQINEDVVISEFLTSLGPWRDYVVIGGGYALIIYKLYLSGLSDGSPPVGTRDIDTLINRRVPLVSEKTIAKYLQEAGFVQNFKDYSEPATESYIKEINSTEIEIEFLTDDCTRDDKTKNISIAGAGIVAQQLSYMQIGLDNTREFKTFSGKVGRVVSAGAWMFHKGLTFSKRIDKMKSYKDLYGIWYMATQLGEYSEATAMELAVLSSYHSQWFKTFKKNICNWLDMATPRDWIHLENQDPYGNLRREQFEEVMRTLVNASSRKIIKF